MEFLCLPKRLPFDWAFDWKERRQHDEKREKEEGGTSLSSELTRGDILVEEIFFRINP